MPHRWLMGDVLAYRKLAQAALAAAQDAERRQTGDVRRTLLIALQRQAKAAFRASYPGPQPAWPVFSELLRLSEDYATSTDQQRRALTAGLERTARAMLQRLGGEDPPPPPIPGAAAAGRPAWWVD